MCKRFVIDNIISSSKLIINGEEHNHLANVLRLKSGEKIIVTCGDAYDYYCVIDSIGKKETQCTVVDKVVNTHNPRGKIDVWQALIKNDKMSLLTQKLNEIGVRNLLLFESKFQTVKASENKQDKLQKISIQSTKQCKRSIPLNVGKIYKFNEMLDVLKNYDYIIFANETEETKKINEIIKDIDLTKSIAIIIGSEGGFDQAEITAIEEIGATSVSLGSRILRAETASIALASFVSFAIGN